MTIKAQQTQELFTSSSHAQRNSERKTSSKKRALTLYSIIWTQCGSQGGIKQSLFVRLLHSSASGWPAKHLFTKRLLFLISLWIVYFSFEVSDPCLPLSPEWQVYLIFPCCLFTLMWIFHVYVLKLEFFPVNLLYVILIIQPAGRTQRGREGTSLPPPAYVSFPL